MNSRNYDSKSVAGGTFEETLLEEGSLQGREKKFLICFDLIWFQLRENKKRTDNRSSL